MRKNLLKALIILTGILGVFFGLLATLGVMFFLEEGDLLGNLSLGLCAAEVIGSIFTIVMAFLLKERNARKFSVVLAVLAAAFLATFILNLPIITFSIVLVCLFILCAVLTYFHKDVEGR